MADDLRTETILAIETTLDDTQPQVIGYVLERALALGALDAYTVAAQMKKQRPGVIVTLLAREDGREALVRLLLEETTTLGVRVSRIERVVAARTVETVETRYGPIRVKRSPGAGAGKATPEYEDCRAAALRHGVPLRAVLRAAAAAGERPSRPRG